MRGSAFETLGISQVCCLIVLFRWLQLGRAKETGAIIIIWKSVLFYSGLVVDPQCFAVGVQLSCSFFGVGLLSSLPVSPCEESILKWHCERDDIRGGWWHYALKYSSALAFALSPLCSLQRQ